MFLIWGNSDFYFGVSMRKGTRIGAMLAVLLLSLNGCAVIAVGSAAVGVAATAVDTAVTVTGAVVKTGAKAVGAAVDAAAGD